MSKAREFWIHNPDHRNTTASVWVNTEVKTAVRFIEKSAADKLADALHSISVLKEGFEEDVINAIGLADEALKEYRE